MPSDSHAVFISYAWGGESEIVANEIDQAISSAGITLIRDKRDLGFKGLIKEFMEQIGQGHAVILVISDNYLKSPNCMFELLEVQKSGDFYQRVFPLVLPDAAIYKSTGIISYLKYWEDQIDELNEAIKKLDSFADTQGIRDDIDLYTDIRGAIAKLAATFRNMNTLTVAEMRSQDFAPLLKVLGKRVAENTSTIPKPKSNYGKILYHIPDLMQIQEWTRCIVRLAWDELLLTENLTIPDTEKEIDDIRMGEVMQVCIEEGRDGNTFEIQSLSSKEQIILVDDYTEWLFDIKALREGTFTLVLRVTLLQIIEGFGERKKDIVLER
ncbi:toll/interleukin-1 receptor domain-containing protein, partial [Algoriphagus sp.]